jgi:hypothetical protein
MIEAGKEEYNIPVEGKVDSDRIPYIVVNGVWFKRSYKSNYIQRSCLVWDV